MDSSFIGTTREFKFTREDFDYLRQVVRDTTGIVSSDDKYTMYYSRLAARLRALGLTDFRAYRDYLSGHLESETIELINSVTTNLTSFFREKHHFEYLRDEIIPRKIRDGERRLRIWSAGCSSGEEAYSIALTLRQALTDINRWDIRILATDIDSQVLETAAAGIYDVRRLNNLDASIRMGYFERLHADDTDRLRVHDNIRGMIQFQQLNLLHRWPMPEKFDLIFCRNVVIYFSGDTKAQLVDRFADQLVDNGLLMMGHSESLYRTSERFESLGKTIYRLIGNGGE